MDHKLRLYHVGPIQECDLDLNDFTVLTGPQASGKSTVAKAVYFFRTVKQDILNIIKQYRTGMTLPGPWSWNSA